MAESVKVAVRVRPFNQREKDRKAVLIVQMQGKTTVLKNPDAKEEPKSFTFDYSYWSHNGYEEKENGRLVPKGKTNYADQTRVFQDLGNGVLENAWKGYNCSLFAYGQTGSGKSYSMVGYGVNKGIVPVTCDNLFTKIEKTDDPSQKYQVSFSMLEIYNEQVRDLLSKENPKGGLQVRQNPKEGSFYVQGLKRVPVQNYKEIEKRIDQGTANRTVASTQMNATSSRAHTVVTIVFDQITKKEGGETKKSSVMNLVDLAGSERADSTGATGDRLKEGANINKSLSALGNVISALADLSMGKKKVMVPYRDSVLTKLLQNALGGNSKTIMIAALSPADINYDETLSTLRYADRAKKIKTKAIVNENPMDKMIRELKEENDRLKKKMQAGDLGVSQGLTSDELEKERQRIKEELMQQLQYNAQQMMTWDDQVAAVKKEEIEITKEEDAKAKLLKGPHIVNLNEDPQLSGVIVHGISAETTVGQLKAQPQPTIPLSGLSIQKQHALITNNNNEIVINTCDSQAQARPKTKVNGQSLVGPMVLEHLDRILFGENHLYVFHNPLNPKSCNKDLPKTITWEFAQKEIAEAKGFGNQGNSNLTKEQQVVQEKVIDLLPAVSEVNAISEELNKYCHFEVVLVSAAAQAGHYGERSTKEVRSMVKMKNLLTENSWLWEAGKFMNRRYLMQDLYQKYLDGDLDENIAKEEDPFWEPPEPVLIGTANVYLQALAYCLDFDEYVTVQDYKGNEEGTIWCSVNPCTSNGKPLDEEHFVENPSDLLKKPYHFKVHIRSASVKKARFSKGLKVKYVVYDDKETTETPTVKATLEPEWEHSKVFTFDSITEDHLAFFDSGCIQLQLFGNQEDIKPDPRFTKMSTKELRQMSAMEKPSVSNRRGTIFSMTTSNDELSELRAELLIAQNMNKRLMHKERRMQELCQEWGKKQETDKKFDPFHRAINAVAFSTGTKFKTRVQVLNKQEEDTISVHAFGEDEEELKKIATKNGDVIPLDCLKKHYPLTINNMTDPTNVALLNGRRYTLVNQGFQDHAEFLKGKSVNGINGSSKDKQSSRACVIQ